MTGSNSSILNSVKRFFGKPINLGKRVVILGIDGLDPGYVRKGMEEDWLPNFKKLANQGGFTPLQSTWVPLSPVAWSSMISGCNPGKHGIFDFLHRDPETYSPQLSIAQQKDPPNSIEIGPYEFPMGSGYTEKGRKGPAFWTESSRQYVNTTVIRCPVSFPPEPVRGKMLSGLGVPDMKGTQGSFTFYTTDDSTEETSRGGSVKIIDHPGRNTEQITLEGPPNPFLCDHPKSEIPIDLSVDGDQLSIELQGQQFSLAAEEWSDWKTIEFNFLGPVSTEGQVRFYLESLKPELELYCSPVNVSSREPAFPISYPEDYASDLTDEIGNFHTLGLTADTGMLKEERVDDVTFLEQTDKVLEERVAMLKHELTSFEDGIFNCVFDIPDRIQHMFWRFEDKKHPKHSASEAEHYGDVIPNLYRRMDEIVGWVMDDLNEPDDLLICSDHGFSSFRRQVDLNTWLHKKGYLSLQDGGSPSDAGPLFHGVDWSKTKAYALGLAGIYVNQRGREKHGIVYENDADGVAKKIASDLMELGDEREKTNPISRAVPSSEVYSGDHTGHAPDVLLGYEEGYRISWESALGGFEGEVLLDNTNKWSGDHGLEPDLIPGSLLTNFDIDTELDVGLQDIIPGLFEKVGLTVPDIMDGRGNWTQ
ncbi:MAG: alkaline phosphatase family protein [bacterium]